MNIKENTEREKELEAEIKELLFKKWEISKRVWVIKKELDEIRGIEEKPKKKKKNNNITKHIWQNK
jgi:hypothetical protein